MQSESDKTLSILFFFPEMIGVAAMVLFSPWWCVQLVHQCHYVYGCLVLSVAIGGGIWFHLVYDQKKALGCLVDHGSNPFCILVAE